MDTATRQSVCSKFAALFLDSHDDLATQLEACIHEHAALLTTPPPPPPPPSAPRRRPTLIINKKKKTKKETPEEVTVFRRTYMGKVRSLLFNLSNTKDNNGHVLTSKLIEGHLTPLELVNMTPLELFPDKWQDAIAKVTFKRLRSEITGTHEEEDGAFQCNKCKSWKTIHTQLQTRSADEPMTIFVSCKKCNKNWKM